MTIYRKAEHTPDSVGSVPDSFIQNLGSGQPLDNATRSFFEPRFRHDFSRVRVHTDTEAAESARAVNALAYTVGRDVVFGAGQYAPGTNEGKRLVAHELTHVVQRSNADWVRVGPSNEAGSSFPISPSLLQRQSAATSDNQPDWHPDFPGCSKDHSRRLDHLLALAQILVIGSIAGLENELEPSPSGIITRTRSALLSNFHTEDLKDIRTIISRFEGILGKLEKGPSNVRCLNDTKCDAVCEGKGAPFACAAPTTPITVCSGVFEQTEDPFYAVVLIHEAAHQLSVSLHTYDPQHRKVVPDERQLALRSADSYANFAEDISLGGRGSFNPHRR